MSKRLEEEAMTYFDECVSLSTFDSSDFSSPEDPPFDFTTPVGDGVSLPQASLGASATNCTKSSLNTKQVNLLIRWSLRVCLFVFFFFFFLFQLKPYI
jgi:hypothetical protein